MAFLFDPHFQAVDANGLPLSGATLAFYAAGTTTPITTYQDSAATTPHVNPVVADSAGNFAAIFLSTTSNYKIVLKTGAGVTVQTIDQIPVNSADLAAITAAAAAGAQPYVDEAEAAAAAAEAAAATVLGLEATAIQGRLSLTSGVGAPESDVSGATSIYYVPSIGRYAPVYDGTNFVSVSVGSQLTMALDADSGHTGYQASGLNYDLFVISDGGTIRLVTGPAWTAGAVAGSAVARGTGAGSTELETFTGILVNKNTITARFGSASGNTVSVPARRATYVGSFRATADGQASDTRRQRFLYNAYNKLMRPVRARDVAVSWTYSTGAYRQANGSATNQVEVLNGLAGESMHAKALSVAQSTAASLNTLTALGIDGVVPASDGLMAFQASIGTASYSIWAEFNGPLGLGFHSLRWLEYGGGSGTQTWYGTNSDTAVFTTGITGWVMS